MNARSALILALAALLAFGACSSEPSQPASVPNYGATPTAMPGTPVVPDGWGTGSPDGPAGVAPVGPAVAGAVNWHFTLADAQAEARSTGRLLLVLSTKPRCSMCDKFKERVAPGAAGELNAIAVGYIYDITRPEVRQVDQTLRANLRGADLMPLVGFLTPELRWVHGFWGARTINQFRGDIATARRIHPVRSARVVPPSRRGGPTLARGTAVVNEFGEPEWSPPGDVWPQGDPEPIDAITGAPDAASDRAAGRTPQPRVADARPPAPDDMRDAAAAVRPPPPVGPVPAQPAAAPGASMPWSAPAASSAAVADRGTAAAATSAPASTMEATEDAAGAPRAAADDLQGWGRAALQRALAQIRAGQFSAARETLSQVQQRMPGTTVAREASKGDVALYNAKRIRLATHGAERSRYLTRARRDFRSSMWGVLFNS